MSTGLVWLRRDLRLDDNAALGRAAAACDRIYVCFVFDREILDHLEDRDDRRVEFIHLCISEIEVALRAAGSRLIVRHEAASEAIPRLAAELNVNAVFASHDYEPARRKRDERVRQALAREGRRLETTKDHVIFEQDDVLTAGGRPFQVYTPYRNAWRAKLTDDDLSERSVRADMKRLAMPPATVRSDAWGLEDLGFAKSDLKWPGGTKAGRKTLDAFLTRIGEYGAARDFPAQRGVSFISPHLRFGTISTRHAIRVAREIGSPGAEKWIDELIWREFYNMVLHHFPHTQTEPIQRKFAELPWRRDRRLFSAWCEGRTGYPFVDAGMRQLNATGFMHNRLRMVTASFLTKHLLVDWRWGERCFARRLLDYDLSQNVGGWQWAASIGLDSQPYFRIFNPVAQSQRFDPDGAFIREHVAELAGFDDRTIHEPWKAGEAAQAAARCRIGRDYPLPIVDHAEARRAALAFFKAAR